jgi:hypothetical protein
MPPRHPSELNNTPLFPLTCRGFVGKYLLIPSRQAPKINLFASGA